MSRALMSSSAATAVFCSLLRRIPVVVNEGAIEPVVFNIGQNRSGQQTADLGDSRGSFREQRANRRGRDRLRRHLHAEYRACPCAFKLRYLLAMPGPPQVPERPLQRVFEMRTRARDDCDMSKRDEVAPAMPLRQSRERVDADDEDERALRRLAAQLAKRVDRVTLSGPPDLARVDRKPGKLGDRKRVV